jgi:membrane-associated phospholipid phosphatase
MARFQPTSQGKLQSTAVNGCRPRFLGRLAAILLLLASAYLDRRALAGDELPARLMSPNPVMSQDPSRTITDAGRVEFQPPSDNAGENIAFASPLNNGRFDDALASHERPSLGQASESDPTAPQVIAAVSDVEYPNVPPSLEVCSQQPPITLTDDAWCFLPRLEHDAIGLANWNNAAILGVALGGSLAIRSELDDSVRNWTAQHPDRWGEGTKIIGNIGVAQYQVPVIIGAYAYTVYTQDAENHEMMRSLISAFTITGLSTLVVKGIADTNRPSDTWNGGKWGFPSYHTASMFAMSAVIDEYKGPWAGVPMYMLSGLVGWARIDTRDHDLSDVVFGAVMGYVIGKSVAGKALYGDSRVHVLPYVHPIDGSPGLLFDVKY